MRFAEVQGGRVVNVSVWDEPPAGAQFVDISSAPNIGIGWNYAEGTFWEPEAESPLASPVPQEVSRAQGKVALIQDRRWPAVLAAVAAIEDPTQRALAEVALHDTTTWERTSPTLNSLATTIGMSQEQVDQLFITASGVKL